MKSGKSVHKELDISHASELSPESLDPCVERFRRRIGKPVLKIVGQRIFPVGGLPKSRMKSGKSVHKELDISHASELSPESLDFQQIAADYLSDFNKKTAFYLSDFSNFL